MLATPKGNTMWNRRLIAMALVCALAACSGDPAPADSAVGTAPGEPAAAVSQDAPASDAVATLSVQELRAAAGLEREVLWVGSLTKIELWSKAGWEQYLSQTPEQYEEFKRNVQERYKQ